MPLLQEGARDSPSCTMELSSNSGHWGGGESSFQKCRNDFVSFEALLEEFTHCFDRDTVEVMVALARQIWLRRNLYVFEGEFRHPNAVFDGAVRDLKKYRRCMLMDRELEDKEHAIITAIDKKWTPPPDEKIKVNWDDSVNAKGECIGLGIVSRDCRGMLLGAKCVKKPILVEPTITKAMAAL